jgi:hypothetical protein
MRRYFTAGVMAGVCALALLVRGPSLEVAAQSGGDPNAGLNRGVVGEVSPLIPMQSVEAVHMGLVWKKNSEKPKILYHARFPEYRVNDIADPALTDRAIERGALTTAGNQFNSSLRDVVHGFDPFLGLGGTMEKRREHSAATRDHEGRPAAGWKGAHRPGREPGRQLRRAVPR